MTYEELEKLIWNAPIAGRTVSTDDAHALIVAILVELKALREELKSR